MTNEQKTPKRWILSNFFAISAVIVTVANLWLATKLIPLTLHVNELGGKVLANEKSIGGFEKDFKYIRNRVDALYNLWIK